MTILIQAILENIRLRLVVLGLNAQILWSRMQQKVWWKEQYKFRNFQQLEVAFFITFNLYLLGLAAVYFYAGTIVPDEYAGHASTGYFIAAVYLFLMRSTKKDFDSFREFALKMAEKADHDIHALHGEVRYWQTRSTMTDHE